MTKTLEQFLERECGIVTPSLLEEFEPHREFVEQSLTNYNGKTVSAWKDGWHVFSEQIWKYLPKVEDHHFNP